LDFIHVSALRPTYLTYSIDSSLTHFLNEFPGLGLAPGPNVATLLYNTCKRIMLFALE